jgi:hypothetical protein
MKTLFNDFRKEIRSRDDHVERRLGNLCQKLETLSHKVENLSQKVDNLFERGAAATIISHLNANHHLRNPILPTSRCFDAKHSQDTRRLFGHFSQTMKKKYANLWTGAYLQFTLSTS